MVRRRKKERSMLGTYIIIFMIVALMIGSVLSVALNTPQSTGDSPFGGQDVRVTSDGAYAIEIDGVERRFHTLPDAVRGMPYDQEVTALLQGAQETTITFNPNVDMEQLQFFDAARFELREAIPNTRSAVTQDSSSYTLPTVTCEQATREQPVIELSTGNPEVTLMDNCITVSGNLTSLFVSKDTLLYNYFGVI